MEALTPFHAFNVSMAEAGRDFTARFVIKNPLVGEPEDRFDHLLRSLLRNKSQVLRLLLLLLADLDAPDGVGGGHPWLQRRVTDGGGTEDFPLLESMLRALGSDPKKLDRVHRLIADLSKTPEGAGLLPAGFQQIWSSIWEVRKVLRG
jgi:hypothetical protein